MQLQGTLQLATGAALDCICQILRHAHDISACMCASDLSRSCDTL
jgi:hypothetical protein